MFIVEGREFRRLSEGGRVAPFPLVVVGSIDTMVQSMYQNIRKNLRVISRRGETGFVNASVCNAMTAK